ncbi:hypothetical protein CYMTET_14367 [Cymbomonas tetramitiformis]|uniref:Uncharacterized protein n=1 Tax=Cymbomonas tetramitiformis TaxID=36881 RepID=A0AAE0LAF7_9CHLO|nr:hypothetical protein CYMTET_14367 [Cymbomonas tetramitiformis]
MKADAISTVRSFRPSADGLRCRRLDKLSYVSPLTRNSSGVSYSWIYRNGEAPNLWYSHMASIEKLPAGGDARYIVVWQAAENFAGAQTMHVRASTSDNLIDWGPSRKIPILASGAIWAPVPFLRIANDPNDECCPRTWHQGMREGSVHMICSAMSPLLEDDFWLFYAESSTCVRDVPDLGRAYAPGVLVVLPRTLDLTCS